MAKFAADGAEIIQYDTASMQTSFGSSIDGGGVVPVTGSKGYFFEAPYNGTITGWRIAGNVSGSAVVDLKRGGVSLIGAGNKPTLSSATDANAAATAWTSVAVTQGDLFELNLDSITTISRLLVVFRVTKSA